MTLGSGPSGYRSGPLRCPECGSSMSERPSGVATVDVCGDCGGVFVDWYDGEVSAAVAGARLPAPLAVRERGDGACPLCRSPMVAAHYPDDNGALVARCGQCAGTFVPRVALDAIVVLGAPDAERGGADEPAWLDAALARLRAFLGW